MRTKIIHAIVVVLFALIVFDLFWLQIVRGGYFARLSETNATRVVPFEGPRGRILDRNGKLLAESVRVFEVAVIPQDIRDKKKLFRFLAGVLDADADELERRYHRNKLTPFSPVVVGEGLTREQCIEIEENTLLYPGLFLASRYGRRYIYDSVGAHLLGYTGKLDRERMEDLGMAYGYTMPQTAGYSGVEEFYDSVLRGEPGGREIEVNSRGQQVRLLSVRDPVPGRDFLLTVDQSMQRVAHAVLDGRRGAAVVLDPSNSEILALVSSPSFDPNAFSPSEGRNRAGDYLTDRAAPMLNRAVSGQFPPGSVFKIPVAAAGLEEHKFIPSMVVNCPGFFQIGNRRFTFAHEFGAQDLFQAMAHSANEYFFTVGIMLGPEQMARYARILGLGERTGVDLPYEAKGRLPARSLNRTWFKGDTANMSIGQGETLASPLQLARMMVLIDNEGWAFQPHVTLEKKDISKMRAVFRRETWAALKKALRAVVEAETGTASELNLPGLATYGKTGTAQSSSGKADHAWFAGVTKGPKRTIAYCVFFEHGGSSKNAVLAVRDMLLQFKDLNLL